MTDDDRRGTGTGAASDNGAGDSSDNGFDDELVDPGPVRTSAAPAGSAEDDQLDVDEAVRNLIRKRDKAG